MNTKLAIQILIGAVGYGVWAFAAYCDPAQRPGFLHFSELMVYGTIGLVLRDMQPAGAVTTPIPSLTPPTEKDSA